MDKIKNPSANESLQPCVVPKIHSTGALSPVSIQTQSLALRALSAGKQPIMVATASTEHWQWQP